MSSYTLSYSSKLTEDYIHTASIMGSGTATQPLATFLNSQNQSEALVIHDDGELCHLQREPLSNSGWNIIGIGAKVASIAAANSGNVWITDNDQNIWMSNAGHWNLIQNLPGGNQQISIGTDGTIYGTAQVGEDTVQYIFDPLSASFQLNQQVAYTSAPVGSANNLWAIDSSDGSAIVTNASGEWMQCQGQPGAAPQTLYACPDQSVWAVGEDGMIYGLDNDGFDWDVEDLPVGITSFAPANQDLVYVLTSTHGEVYNPTLYSCDCSGNNTVLAQPVGRPLLGISVGLDGSFWGLDLVGTVWRYSKGAWIRTIQPTDLSGSTGGLQVTEVVTGRHALGDQYAFYVIDTELYWSVFQEQSGVFGGYWTEKATVFSGISNISVVNDPVTASNLIVYGVSSKGNLVVVQNVKGEWTPVEHSMKTSLAGAKAQFSTLNSAWYTYAVIDQTLHLGVGGLNNPATTLSPIADSPKLSSLIPFSTNVHGADTILLAGIDLQGQVWTIMVSSDLKAFVVQQLSGPATESPIGNVQSAVGSLFDSTTGARIYARDQDNMLWVIRESIFVSFPQNFVWTDWHPLGNDCMVLASGCTIAPVGAGPLPPVDLFSLDSGNQVNVLSEDPLTGLLTDLVMQKPAGTNTDAEYVTRYLTELTITDENSLPQSGFQVSVTADEAVGIWVGDALLTVGPSQSPLLTTNKTGSVTFAFFASDLHTPTFSFEAEGLLAPPSIYPAAAVNAYLSGQPGALPGRPDFDAQGRTLQAAQMQTQPEWSTLPTPFVQAQDQTNAPSAAQGITQICGLTTSVTGPSGAWQVAASQDTVGSSRFWSDLCAYGHDIDHAVKNAAIKVKSISVQAEQRLVTFTMELANGLSQALQLVINTVRDVVSAVKSIFRYLERGVDEAIHWLKSLFAWGDVLNTKNVIETCLNGLMSKMEENLNPTSSVYAGTLFNTYFNDFVNQINDGFKNAEAVFSPTQTFSSTSGSVPYPAAAQPLGSDALHPTSVSSAQSANSTHSNYVHTHTLNYAGQGGAFPSTAMGDGTSGDSILETLFSQIGSNLNQDPFKTAHMETITSFQSIFSDPKNFADVVVFDVINAIQKAVMLLLDVVESVIDALISLAGNALAGFQAMLNKPIDIPVISWIYLKISDHPLTLLDLFCLAMALPATLLYKLTLGLPNAMPPFTAESAQKIITQFGDPDTFPWPAIASKESSSPGSHLLGSFPFPGAEFLLPGMSALYAIIDPACDATAYKNLQITPFPEALPPDPVDTFLSHMSIITSMGSQWLTANYSIFDSQSSAADRMTLANWGLNFLPVTSSLVFTIGSSHKAIAEFNATYGLTWTSASGILLTVMGVATSIVQALDKPNNYTALNYAQNVIAPLPNVMKPLIAIEGQPQGAIACGVLIVADLMFDLANGTLAFLEDIL